MMGGGVLSWNLSMACGYGSNDKCVDSMVEHVTIIKKTECLQTTVTFTKLYSLVLTSYSVTATLTCGRTCKVHFRSMLSLQEQFPPKKPTA